jgi:hypothetical protein
VFVRQLLTSLYLVDKGFLNVPVNLNLQATDASVRKMENCAVVGAIIMDPVIINDVFIF